MHLFRQNLTYLILDFFPICHSVSLDLTLSMDYAFHHYHLYPYCNTLNFELNFFSFSIAR
jgi:hypothetical protein